VISVSPYFGFDEKFAIEAAKYPVASQFVSGMSMSERWLAIRRLSTGDRPLWTLWHLLWGSVIPSNGSAAFVLTLLSSAVALLALCGAARRLGGNGHAGIVAAVVSLSPLAFHYSTSVMAPPLAAMWICIAIYALSSRRWAVGEWGAAGFCLGLAFGTHMGAGPPIVGLAAGLGVSAIAAGRCAALAPRERLRRLFFCPLSGAIAAAAPLLLVEWWARSSGDTYIGRLRHHEDLNYAGVGPFGLWIRELFELDPMMEILVVLLLIGAIRRSQPGGRKRAARVAALFVAALLALSLRDAPPRATVSLFLFGAIAAGIAYVVGLGGSAPSGESQLKNDDKPSSPLSPQTVLVAALVTGVFLTLWRSVGCMPRLTFAAWPLFVLALTGAAMRGAGAPRAGSLARPLGALACVLAALGAFAVIRLRGIEARSSGAAARHPGWVKLVYEDLWAYEDRMRAAGWLATRASFDAEVIVAPALLYPIAAYEEEPYKLLLFRDTVKDFQLGGVVSWVEAPWAVFFFEPGPTVPREVAAERRPLRASN
jgi:hypothetical protein